LEVVFLLIVFIYKPLSGFKPL